MSDRFARAYIENILNFLLVPIRQQNITFLGLNYCIAGRPIDIPIPFVLNINDTADCEARQGLSSDTEQ
jgi:hypothetical protein